MKRKQLTLISVFFALSPILAMLICLEIGRYHISVPDTIKAIGTVLAGGEIDGTVYSVLFKVRLSRILLAMFVGAGLSVA